MQNNFSEQSIQYSKQLLSIKLAICSSKRILHVKSRPMIPCPWDLALNNSLWHFLSEIFAHPFTLYRFTTPNLYFTPSPLYQSTLLSFSRFPDALPQSLSIYILEKHISPGGQVSVFGKITELVIMKSRSLDDTKKIREVSWDLTGW